MTERECIVHRVKRTLLPLPGLVIFHVARGGLIKLRFAHVVQQRTYRKAFFTVALVKPTLAHRLVDIQAVHHKAAFAGTVELCACRRGVKIGGIQPRQKLLRALARDVLCINGDKFLSVRIRHACPPVDKFQTLRIV